MVAWQKHYLDEQFVSGRMSYLVYVRMIEVLARAIQRGVCYGR